MLNLSVFLSPIGSAFLFASMVLTAAMTPLVRIFGHVYIPRAITVFFTYLTFLGVLSLVAALLVPLIAEQGHALAQELPTMLPVYWTKINELVARWSPSAAAEMSKNINELGSQVSHLFATAIDTFSSLVSTVISLSVDSILVLVLAFFLTIEHGSIKNMVNRLVKAEHRPGVSAVIDRITFETGRWSSTQLLLALFFGVATGTLLHFMHVPYAITIGFVGGVLDIIPYGGAIAFLLAVIIQLQQDWFSALMIMVGYFVIVEVEWHMLAPPLLDRYLHLKNVVIVLALAIGSTMFGILGALLAIPGAIVLRALLDYWLPYEPDLAAGQSHALSNRSNPLPSAPGANGSMIILHCVALAPRSINRPTQPRQQNKLSPQKGRPALKKSKLPLRKRQQPRLLSTTTKPPESLDIHNNHRRAADRSAAPSRVSLMTKRHVAFGLLYTVMVTAAALLWFAVCGSHQLVFSQDEIQRRIDPKLPMAVQVKLPAIVAKHLPKGATRQLNVTGVNVAVHKDKVWLHIDANTTEFNHLINASAEAEGVLEYRAVDDPIERGAFFFHPTAVTITSLTVGDKPVEEKVQSKIGAMAGKLADRLGLEIPREELHEMVHEYMQQALEEGAALILNKVPAYTFKDDWKGHAASMALTKVEVRDSNVVVTLSFLQLTLFVIGYAITIAAALVLVVLLTFMFPTWGLLLPC